MSENKSSIINEIKQMSLAELINLLIANGENINHASLEKKSMLDAKEVLEEYPMFSTFTLNKAIQYDGLPYFKNGHKRYFNRMLIDKWIEDRNTSLSEKNKNRRKL